ncbi:MAG: hypothetical protein RLN60_05630 [Phycisphaerales bacterium]
MRNSAFQSFRALILAAVALFVSASAATAQFDPASGEVEISVDYFGVGDIVRPGDWAGIRLSLNDLGDEPRDVSIRLHAADPDGDTALFQREILLTPGAPAGTWLYMPLPWSLSGSNPLTITVHEADVSGERPVIGRQIAYERVVPKRVASPDNPMIAIVGRETFGLLQYEERGRRQQDESVTSHDLVRVVHSIDPALYGLPTEWLGLAPFEAMVWTEGDPNLLPRLSHAEAIREWVNRGGHLVIVMEPVADGWFAASNPLADLLPDVTVVRHEEASLEPYRDLLVRPRDEYKNIRLPSQTVVHSFVKNPGAERNDAISLFEGPEGTVVTRRLLGTGMVTVIGLDLAAGGIDRRNLIRTDAFWNRIFGKRADSLTGPEIDSVEQGGLANTIRGMGSKLADSIVSREINLTGTVSVGVLFGLALFSVYWIVAGFGSYAGLKSRGLEHHSWLMFVLVIALFTGIAWAGARFLKPTDVSARHVTILDHVYGEPVQSARSFASIMLPEYGTQRVSIAPQSADEPWRQALVPWSDPKDAGTTRSFPDAREYVVSTRKPDGLAVPARQTVKQFRADWLGAPVWTMPVPQGEAAFPEAQRDGTLRGVLAHGLPAALEDVVIFYVRGPRPVDDVHERWEREETGLLMSEVLALELNTAWSPGQPLDLSILFTSELLGDRAANAEVFFREIVPFRSGGQVLGIIEETSDSDYELVNFAGALYQPEYKKGSFDRVPVRVRRQATHTLDISHWLTQPCIIIVGSLEDAPCPVPFQLDGRPIPTIGRTVVRWMFPLDDTPLRVR